MSKTRQALTGALVFLWLLAPAAYAFDVGHSRVTSAPGKPLAIDVTIRNLTESDLANFSVTLPSLDAWQASGLKPPVALEQLQVRVFPGTDNTSRILRLSSGSASSETVIDVLLDVSTGSANRTIQTSVIVLPPPSVNLPSGQSTTIMRGDTLIGIANQFPVSGANLYQRLWALYVANPAAFMSENMNLLKSGATLNIPDAETVRAVDPGFAKARYLAHVQAFQRMKSGGSAVSVGDQSASAAAAPSDQNQGQVEPATPAAVAPEQDQVRVSSDPVDVTADQQTSEARAMAEEKARTEALQESVAALESAVAASATEGTAGARTEESAQATAASDSATQSQNAANGGTNASPTSSASSASSASGQSSATDSDAAAAAVSGSGAGNGAVSGDASGTNSTAATQASAANNAATASEPAQDAVSQAMDWVKDNVAASIAIVLALAALILAWALRATSRSGDISSAATAPEVAFQKKLAGIDLSLGDTEGDIQNHAPGDPASSVDAKSATKPEAMPEAKPEIKPADAKKDDSA